MGGHEGNEEKEAREQDCKGQACKGLRLQRWKGEDRGWLEKVRLDEEQGWKDCKQETVRSCQIAPQKNNRRLDRRCREGQKGTWCEGFQSYQEGHSSLR